MENRAASTLAPWPPPPTTRSNPLDDYLATVDPSYHDLVRVAHQAILASGEPFDIAIKYRMLMYTRGGDWRNWIIAVSQMKRAVNVRFLGGTLLDDPGGRLRYGTSHLETLDIPTLEAFDADVVTGYARQACRLYDTVRDTGTSCREPTRGATSDPLPLGWPMDNGIAERPCAERGSR